MNTKWILYKGSCCASTGCICLGVWTHERKKEKVTITTVISVDKDELCLVCVFIRMCSRFTQSLDTVNKWLKRKVFFPSGATEQQYLNGETVKMLFLLVWFFLAIWSTIKTKDLWFPCSVWQKTLKSRLPYIILHILFMFVGGPSTTSTLNIFHPVTTLVTF